MNLFEKEEYVLKGKETDIKKQIVNEEFRTTYRDMTNEVNRVSIEKFTLYDQLCIWVYKKVHGPTFSLKQEQTIKELIRSTNGFKKVISIFKPLPDKSINQEEVIPYIQKRFDRE